MRSRVSTARLGAFWFGLQIVWGAFLGVSLQARTIELVRINALERFGVIAAVGPIVAAIAQLAFGRWSDRRRARGSRRTEFYVVGAAGAAAGLAWFYLAPSFTQLVLAVLAVQLCMNAAIAAYQAAIPDVVPDERTGEASGWMAAMQSGGNAAGALIASFVASHAAVAATLGVAVVVTAWASASHVRTLALRDAASARVQLTRALLDLLISRAFLFLGFYTLVDYLLFYVAQTFGGSEQSVKQLTGVVLLVFTIAGAVGAMIAARPADRGDRRFVAAFGAAIFIVALLGFIFAHSVVATVVAAVIAGVAWSVVLTADWALGCTLLPPTAVATSMAVWNLALIVPQIAAPALTTATLRVLHVPPGESTRLAFGLAAAEVLAGMAWLFRLPPQRRGV